MWVRTNNIHPAKVANQEVLKRLNPSKNDTANHECSHSPHTWSTEFEEFLLKFLLLYHILQSGIHVQLLHCIEITEITPFLSFISDLREKELSISKTGTKWVKAYCQFLKLLVDWTLAPCRESVPSPGLQLLTTDQGREVLLRKTTTK